MFLSPDSTMKQMTKEWKIGAVIMETKIKSAYFKSLKFQNKPNLTVIHPKSCENSRLILSINYGELSYSASVRFQIKDFVQ
jgi:hypothetical protein